MPINGLKFELLPKKSTWEVFLELIKLTAGRLEKGHTRQEAMEKVRAGLCQEARDDIRDIL